MKICIVGCGAMGSVYAAHFVEAGHDVWGIDIWQDHIDAIQTAGLQICGYSGDRSIPNLRVSTEVEDAGRCDLFIVATKADGVRTAARSILSLLDDDTIVLTIQNGLGAAERICEVLPKNHVLIGVAEGFGASIPQPGTVHHNGMRMVRLGEIDGGLSPRLKRIESLWIDSGFTAKAFENINQLIWEKFVCNVTFSAPCTVFNRSVREMMADPHSWQIALGCGVEAFEVGCKLGIPFSFDDPEKYIEAYAKTVLDAKPSMVLDHLAQKRSEIDFINGMVPEVAQTVGLKAPYNEVVTAIVRSKELAY